MDSLAEQVVDAINDISGRHEGHRAAHAKGTLLRGTFTGGRLRAHDGGTHGQTSPFPSPPASRTAAAIPAFRTTPRRAAAWR